MQKIFLGFLLGVIISIQGYSQKIPTDYHNSIVKKGQKATTYKFTNFLEQGKIEDALSLIDTSFLRIKNKYKDSLTAYYKELSKYIKSTQLSVVIVYPDTNYNTYRCRYFNNSGDFFYIDLYYKVGQPNSPIAKIWKQNARELEKERKELEKRAKEPIPPPPPPPPGIEMKPVKKIE